MSEEWVTVTEAARIAGVADRTARRYAARMDSSAVRRSGRSGRLVRLADFLEIVSLSTTATEKTRPDRPDRPRPHDGRLEEELRATIARLEADKEQLWKAESELRKLLDQEQQLRLLAEQREQGMRQEIASLKQLGTVPHKDSPKPTSSTEKPSMPVESKPDPPENPFLKIWYWIKYGG